jgi:hypothetical protein
MVLIFSNFLQNYLNFRIGSKVSVLVHAAALDEGRTVAFVQDITRIKEAESVALEAAKAKSYFVANISHGECISIILLLYISIL